MKCYISLFCLLFSFGRAYAQTTVPGFYISLERDTVDVQVKIPKALLGHIAMSDFLDKVKIIDSAGGERVYKPGDIKEYGFLLNGIRYHLYSKPIHRNGVDNPANGSNKFIQAVIVGPRTSLYQYLTSNGGTSGISYGNTLYVFEKPDRSYAFLSIGATLNKWQETLQEFYKDIPSMQPFIAARFQKRLTMQSDIRDIVQAVNKL